MKILFIGNSFSTDSTRYIQKIANGELFVRNLYIGGCSLETHAKNIEGNLIAYEYQSNAETIGTISIKGALIEHEWDVVSVQQVSSLSGVKESYEPYIATVLDEIKKYAPGARIVFHRTWAYEDGSDHPAFVNYGNDRGRMFRSIMEATEAITKKYGLDVIPCGNVIELARLKSKDDEKMKDVVFTRDSFHLSLTCGRYIAGLTLYRFFTGGKASNVEFIPQNCDTYSANWCKSIVDSYDFT